ncbi:MAG: hypothetical protein IJ815_08230, partial [Lachnospiraceae bacterium]|nr:hypothetical protein [Lachnospiraceae bacterium]
FAIGSPVILWRLERIIHLIKPCTYQRSSYRPFASSLPLILSLFCGERLWIIIVITNTRIKNHAPKSVELSGDSQGDVLKNAFDMPLAVGRM